MAQRYKAFLQQTLNSRYVVMVQKGDDIMEVAGPDWYEDAVVIRDRFNAGDWDLLNEVRYDNLAEAMFHNGNPKKFPDAPKPKKGWRLW